MTYKESDSLRIYKDGKFLGGYGVTGQFKLSSETGFKAYIGHSDYGDVYYNGLLDDVRISDIMRSKTEIRNMAESLNLLSIVSALDEDITLTPTKFSLQQNYPNPFNPKTVISYQLPKNSKIKLTIYDVTGQQIKTLFNSWHQAGNHEVVFDAADLPSGIYFYVLKSSNGFNQTRKMMLLK
jgi:hypothetical protein